MNLNHLTDIELIQYVLKHESDPVRIRLAGIMDRMPGRILDGLERAGMDPQTCLHENLYESGEYITHLENEIKYLSRELQDTQDQLAKRETMTVSQLIEELHYAAHEANRRADVNLQQAREADREREEMRGKMKVWRAISTDVSR